MRRLVAEAKPGVWKEEAVWAAGESSLELTYSCSPPYWAVYYGTRNDEPPPEPEPEHFERLVREFPQSPLRPYAEWRLADCKRRQAINRVHERYGPYALRQPQPIAALFEKVEAPKGSYAWAWTQLRLGVLAFDGQDYKKASGHFAAVADAMDHGAEKSLALMNAGTACRAAGDVEGAAYYRIARTVPDISWWSRSPYERWAPLGLDGTPANGGDTNALARKVAL